MELKAITSYLDNYLELASFSEQSANGLQVENSGDVHKIGLAVDPCLEAILRCAEAGCNLLIVHHGLFRGGESHLVGHVFRRLRALIMSDIALYAVHLPLDAHPEVGNNVQIARMLDLRDIQPVGCSLGRPIGVKGSLRTPTSCAQIIPMLESFLGRCHFLVRFGPEQIHSVGVISGSATDASLFQELRAEGIDLLVTGEPKHGAYHLAQECGLNIFYGGHYQTETFGVTALGKHLAARLGLAALFLEVPSPF